MCIFYIHVPMYIICIKCVRYSELMNTQSHRTATNSPYTEFVNYNVKLHYTEWNSTKQTISSHRRRIIQINNNTNVPQDTVTEISCVPKTPWDVY